MNYALETVKIIFYLALVLGIIYLLANLLKNRFTGQTDGRYIHVLERVYLGPKTGLTLIKVEDRVLLLGISESRVEVIDSWSKAEFSEIKTSLERGFKDYLQDLIKGSRRDQHD